MSTRSELSLANPGEEAVAPCRSPSVAPAMSYTIFGKKMYVFCCCDMLAEGPLRNRRRLADLAPPLSSSTSLALPAPLERHPASGHLSNSVFALSPAVLASFALNEYIALGTYGLVALDG
ncbi:hypothetical protein RTBOTA2_005674 [Rhodotorula toruloides]|nr:hypothetical protein RTBOTA2_005674 [Rhodotorula toruloides]